MRMSGSRLIGAGVVSAIVLLVVGYLMPSWLLFTMTKAAGYGLVALGITVLMRGGLVSFGQGMVYCVGAYAGGLVASRGGITDVFVLLIVGGVSAAIVGAIVGPLIARYRGIFFAMLSLALSMVVYGILVKMNSIGGSDGFTVPEATYLGWQPGVDTADFALFAVTAVVAVVASVFCRFYFDSMSGLLALAVRENELRVEYLGSSVFRVTVRNFVIAATLGGIGGTVNGLALGHVDPFFAFWTTSGEFVFIAVLSGYLSVSAVFVSSLILELVRSFSTRFFPETWQLVLGVFLIIVIVFMPQGIGSLWERVRARRDRRPAPAPRGTPGSGAKQQEAGE